MTDAAAKPRFFAYSILLLVAVLLLHACGVKNYPPNKPFVYESGVEIEGKYTTNEKKELKTEMENQLHDSIIPRRKRVLFFFRPLRKPPVFDTVNISKSITFMRAQLNTMGYYRDSIPLPDVKFDTVGDQIRTTIQFHVTPGKMIRIDSLYYNLLDSVPYTPELDSLQTLTVANPEERIIKKGTAFSKTLISAELDRLTNVYRNNGFLRFSKEQLLAVWDTVGINLLRPALDIEEQLRQLEALRARRENPVADVEIRLAPNPDTGRLKRYYVGRVRVFPDYNADTLFYEPKYERIVRGNAPYEFTIYSGQFLPRKLIRFIYLKPGELYRQSNFLKTQNKFNSVGALPWRLVTINQFPRNGEDSVDFDIRLIPAKKYTAGVNLDVSRNQGNLGIEGSLLGLGASFNLVNRNFLKGANHSALTFRYGVELATRLDLVQTQQFTLGYTIQFPRLVPRANFIDPKWRENVKTFMAFSVGRTDRIDYFNVSSATATLGWQFNFEKTIHRLRFPNIEYYSLTPDTLLKALISQNASYKYIFNDGLIVSGLYNIEKAGGSKDKTNIFRASIEMAGFPGVIKALSESAKLYSFVKLDAEFVRTLTWRRTALAFRTFAGIGKTRTFSLKSGKPDTINYYLPFFRQYYAGGPNSMRAWSVRKLGPGSAVNSYDRNAYPDRFGDMRLETNLEYRFFLANLVTYPLEGALFVDAGNVWFLRDNPTFENETFNWSRLWQDLAIGVGYGLRVDFGFLKVRADLGYKAKDPSPDINNLEAQNKWFYKWKFTDAQFQLGINYPF